MIIKEIESLVLNDEDVFNFDLNLSHLYTIQFYEVMGRTLATSFYDLTAAIKDKNLIPSLLYYHFAFYNTDHKCCSYSGRLYLNNTKLVKALH